MFTNIAMWVFSQSDNSEFNIDKVCQPLKEQNFYKLQLLLCIQDILSDSQQNRSNYLWGFQGLQVVVQVEIAPAALGAIYNKKQI